MALIPCHECSGQVSDHARTCPHCGAPVIATIKRKQKAVLIELGVRLGFVVVIIIVFWIGYHKFTKQFLDPLKPKPPTQQSTH